MRAKLIGATALAAAGALLAQAQSVPLRVSDVRIWSPGAVTRIAIEVSGGDFEFHSERLHNPPRVFFDVFRARPAIGGKRLFNLETDDKLVSRVRVAETLPGVTRVVLDLSGPVEYTVSKLANPARLLVELRPAAPEPAQTESAPVVTSAEPTPHAEAPRAAMAGEPESAAPPIARTAASAPAAKISLPPAKATVPEAESAAPPVARTAAAIPAPKISLPPAIPISPAKPEIAATVAAPPARTAAPPAPKAAPTPAAPAARTTDGKNSLIRALGLKIQRVVIDPGHGGHDQGTVGRRGLVEKDLVLDIARRLGALIEQQIGCEVVYTRTEDAFVPLEARTELANAKKADLFISLHANSSRYPRIAGVETFFLNFTTDRDAMDVAARENASSNKNVSELQDVLQKIARQEKIAESQELAKFVQGTMHAFSARHNPGVRNRGVKKAPFVVLVGAKMPSVLVEIGFLSNSREENLLKRPDHRQKVADALVRGISRYIQSLSHFQVARANE